MTNEAVGRRRGQVKRATPSANDIAKYLSERCTSPRRHALELIYEALTMRGRAGSKRRFPHPASAYRSAADTLLGHAPAAKIVGDEGAFAFALSPAEFLARFLPVWADERGELSDAWGKELVGDEQGWLRVPYQFHPAENRAQQIEWLAAVLEIDEDEMLARRMAA